MAVRGKTVKKVISLYKTKYFAFVTKSQQLVPKAITLKEIRRWNFGRGSCLKWDRVGDCERNESLILRGL